MNAGARDAFFTPVYMKKNRPGYMLTVICDEKNREDMEELILRETTTLGIRRFKTERTTMGRDKGAVDTKYGKIEVKYARMNGIQKGKPEYESVREAAALTGVPFREVYEAAALAMSEKGLT
jgi:hypothetical protein